MNLEEYKIELLSDFDELINFYTGKDKMDDFLHNHLQDCEESHYCKTFCVRLKANNTIVAIFALAFHTSNYSAVGFYEKNQFAKLTPVPQMDVWPMYKTIWPKE